MEQIRMVDLHSQYLRLKEDIDRSVMTVLDHCGYIQGQEVTEFQHNLSTYLGVKHTIPCANGTDALLMALMSLDLQPGDEVITPAFSFISAIEVIGLLKLKPVVVDVDPDIFNVPTRNIEQAITSKTKAILPVHLFGQSTDMETLQGLAKHSGVHIIEDNAQSLGGESHWMNGTKMKLGSIGHIGCTSFFPSKILGCFGDGGACFTNDDDLAFQLRCIANHGSGMKYFNDRLGINSRLDTIQAAVLNVKLKQMDDFIYRRQTAAAFYDHHLKPVKEIQIPVRSLFSNHVFHQYTIRVLNGQRDQLKNYLEKKGIPTMVYYPVPLHQQKVYQKLGGELKVLPNVELLSKQVLSLPMHTELTDEQLLFIVQGIHTFFKYD